MVNDKIPLKTFSWLMLTIILWASAFVGIRAGLVGYSPGGLALLRYAVASFCMFFIYQKLGRKDKIPLKDKLLLMLIGAIGIGWYNITLNYGEITVTSGTAGFIVSQSPIISSVLAIIFLGERARVLSFFGMMVSVLGVFLISVGEAGGIKWQMGIGYILMATLLGSFYSIAQKPFLKKYHAIDATAYIIWGCTFSLLVYAKDVMHDALQASWVATSWVIYLGVFPAAVAYVAWSYALSTIPASRAVSFLYFTPIFTIFLGWIFLGEMPALISLMGGGVAMLGVWVVNRSYRQPVLNNFALKSES